MLYDFTDFYLLHNQYNMILKFSLAVKRSSVRFRYFQLIIKELQRPNFAALFYPFNCTSKVAQKKTNIEDHSNEKSYLLCES